MPSDYGGPSMDLNAFAILSCFVREARHKELHRRRGQYATILDFILNMEILRSESRVRQRAVARR
jgi:hypothetical protein